MPHPQEDDYGKLPYSYRRPPTADQYSTTTYQNGITSSSPVSVPNPAVLDDISGKLDTLIQQNKDLIETVRGLDPVSRNFQLKYQSAENVVVAPNTSYALVPINVKGPLFLSTYVLSVNSNLFSLNVNVDGFVETATKVRLEAYGQSSVNNSSFIWPVFTQEDPVLQNWTLNFLPSSPMFIQNDLQLNLINTGSSNLTISFFRMYYYQKR